MVVPTLTEFATDLNGLPLHRHFAHVTLQVSQIPHASAEKAQEGDAPPKKKSGEDETAR
jgi:hypothetical protein